MVVSCDLLALTELGSSLLLILMISLDLDYNQGYFDLQEESKFAMGGFLIATFVISLGIFILLTSLTIFHMYLKSNKQTTYDYIIQKRKNKIRPLEENAATLETTIDMINTKTNIQVSYHKPAFDFDNIENNEI